MGLRVKQRGSFDKTRNSLSKMATKADLAPIFAKYGERGVDILSDATPRRTGLTANSWGYRVVNEDGKTKLVFYNTNVNKGVSIAVILQTGHGTRGGGYVQGVDYINPASATIFKEMCSELWNEVRSL